MALASPANPTGEVHLPARLRELAEVAAQSWRGRRSGRDLRGLRVRARPSPTCARSPPIPPACTPWGFAKDFGLPRLQGGRPAHHRPGDPCRRPRPRLLRPRLHPHPDPAHRALSPTPPGCTRSSPRTAAASAPRTRRAAALLDAFGIPYAPAQAGCSIWADLGARLLRPSGFAGERALWWEILDRTHVSILPGEAFHAPRPGWFRISPLARRGPRGGGP
ncbi:aminotransferase class I/II-fold pyridoxal phosphate-dependent enzyme [Streptomyces sp. L7]